MAKETNLKEVAKRLTELEGKKHGVNIFDMTEILSAFLHNFDILDIIKMWIKANKA